MKELKTFWTWSDKHERVRLDVKEKLGLAWLKGGIYMQYNFIFLCCRSRFPLVCAIIDDEKYISVIARSSIHSYIILSRIIIASFFSWKSTMNWRFTSSSFLTLSLSLTYLLTSSIDIDCRLFTVPNKQIAQVNAKIIKEFFFVKWH